MQKKTIEAADFIKSFLKEQKWQADPEIAVILGSGLGDLAEKSSDIRTIPYGEIPGFPVSTVPGHKSRMLFGYCRNIPVLFMQGRFHMYEGYSSEEIAFPILVLKKLGVKILLITNAAGGINRSLLPGDLMVISDHINFTGRNPLTGPNDDLSGPRFPDLSDAYSAELRRIAFAAAKKLDIDLKEGVYAWFTGPSYETPAEIRMADRAGADAVGMSTVPETIIAVHSGLKVLGISCITNMAAGISEEPIEGDHVIDIAAKKEDEFAALIQEIISMLQTR